MQGTQTTFWRRANAYWPWERNCKSCQLYYTSSARWTITNTSTHPKDWIGTPSHHRSVQRSERISCRLPVRKGFQVHWDTADSNFQHRIHTFCSNHPNWWRGKELHNFSHLESRSSPHAKDDSTFTELWQSCLLSAFRRLAEPGKGRTETIVWEFESHG